jgi:DNA-binding response OmpR family regulator
MAAKILVVEDEPALMDTLVYNLTGQGYKLLQADSGTLALKIAREQKPDLILLDIMLPGMDGFEVCRILRQESSVPILMLTARDEVVDRVVGLEVGADDYLTKPFSMRELTARVKALLRRERLIRERIDEENDSPDPVSGKSQQMRFGDLVIDQTRREVRLKGKALHLRPKEYDLLVFLARNKGIALSRDLILERVWGWEHDGSSRTLDVHIRWLRTKIEPEPGRAGRIVTVRGIGYRFEG